MPSLRSGPWSTNWIGFALTIGKGGQGQTHKVFSLIDDEVGILKHMKEGPAKGSNAKDPTARARIHRESMILERCLMQPGVPTLLDSNCDNHKDLSVKLYFVTRFIGGITLDRYLSIQKRVLPDHAIEIVIKLLETVEWLHNLSWPILHRDIKPANIIMNSKDEPVLIDFGLAYTAKPGTDDISDEAIETLTKDDESIGNIFLRLPERVDDRRNSISDVTLCCGILFYLLTGEPPNNLDTPPHQRTEAAEILAREHPDDVTSINEIFDRGFKYSTTERFQSASELKSKLEQVLDGLVSISPSRELSRSYLADFAPVVETIAQKFSRYQTRFFELITSMEERANIDEEESAELSIIEALDAIKNFPGLNGVTLLDVEAYDLIKLFVYEFQDPKPGSDEYFLVWYPAIIKYLETKLQRFDAEAIDEMEAMRELEA